MISHHSVIVADGVSKRQEAAAEPMEAAIHVLIERLLEAWAECTPSQLSAAPEPAAAACCHSILVCTKRLLDRLPPGPLTPPKWYHCWSEAGRQLMCIWHGLGLAQ